VKDWGESVSELMFVKKITRNCTQYSLAWVFGSFRILLPFFQTSWRVGVLNSVIFNSFHNRVEFGTILEVLRNFGEVEPQTPPQVRHSTIVYIDFTV